MSRPPFSLTDDQARDLVRLVGPLLDRYPLDRRDHRPFLRAFLRAVYEVTDKLYGPDVYRRLLKAYAPDRSPSTATIVTERDALERELRAESVAPEPATAPAPGRASAALDTAALRAVFADHMPQFARLAAQAGRDTQVDYLTSKLQDTEHALADARALAARLAGEAQAQSARADLLAGELATCQAALADQRQAVGRLTEELKGQRLFAMQSIELSRAETRLAKERTAELQAKMERLEITVDQLRIARSAAGAAR